MAGDKKPALSFHIPTAGAPPCLEIHAGKIVRVKDIFLIAPVVGNHLLGFQLAFSLHGDGHFQRFGNVTSYSFIVLSSFPWASEWESPAGGKDSRLHLFPTAGDGFSPHTPLAK